MEAAATLAMLEKFCCTQAAMAGPFGQWRLLSSRKRVQAEKLVTLQERRQRQALAGVLAQWRQMTAIKRAKANARAKAQELRDCCRKSVLVSAALSFADVCADCIHAMGRVTLADDCIAAKAPFNPKDLQQYPTGILNGAGGMQSQQKCCRAFSDVSMSQAS